MRRVLRGRLKQLLVHGRVRVDGGRRTREPRGHRLVRIPAVELPLAVTLRAGGPRRHVRRRLLRIRLREGQLDERLVGSPGLGPARAAAMPVRRTRCLVPVLLRRLAAIRCQSVGLVLVVRSRPRRPTRVVRLLALRLGRRLMKLAMLGGVRGRPASTRAHDVARVTLAEHGTRRVDWVRVLRAQRPLVPL